MKRIFLLLGLVSNITFAVDNATLEQKINKDTMFHRCGPICAGIGAGVEAATYTINNGISNGGFDNFSWGALANHAAWGAAAGFFAGPVGLIWGANADLAEGVIDGIISNYNNRK